jgi:phage shock protein PspC (stress-responsive transcriptional regulator)
MAAFDVAVVLLLGLVVLRIPGWLLPAWTVGVALGLRASVSLGFPFDASAFDTAQAILILVWLVVFALAVRFAYGAASLTRQLDRAVVAGVAAGLAAAWGRRPIWFRIAFAVVPPLGALVYGVLWILVPPGERVEERPTAEPSLVERRGSWIRLAVLGASASVGIILVGPTRQLYLLIPILLGLVLLLARLRRRRSPNWRRVAGAVVIAGSAMPLLLVGLVGWTGGLVVPVVPHQVDSLEPTYCTSCHRNPGVARGAPIIDAEMVRRGNCVDCHRYESTGASSAGSDRLWHLPLASTAP